MGMGSGRLTVALAEDAEVTGVDTNAEQFGVARRRATEAGVDLRLVEADFNGGLPFDDVSFDAVVSRLALMAADDPVRTLGEFRRVLAPGGRFGDRPLGSPAENPWFGVPREAIAAALGHRSVRRSHGHLDGWVTRMRPRPSIELRGLSTS